MPAKPLSARYLIHVPLGAKALDGSTAAIRGVTAVSHCHSRLASVGVNQHLTVFSALLP